MDHIDLAQLLRDPESVFRRVIDTGEALEVRVGDSAVQVAARDGHRNLIEAAREARDLLDAFDDVAPDDMTAMFYIHAFNELTLGLRTLLESIEEGRQQGGPALERP